MQKILNLYKEEGETPLQTIERFRKENPEYQNLKMSYMGRLDPMAEGVLLVLVGEECKNKDKYLALPKEYVFEVLFGIQTDTYDILGVAGQPPHRGGWTATSHFPDLQKLKGKFLQKYPPYSSKPVNGRSLFEWAKSGDIKNIDIPEKEVEIYDIEILDSYEISREALKENIFERISKVVGGFRQEEILKNWEEKLRGSTPKLVVKIKISCSSGTYVRGIANSLGGLAFKIKRTKLGEYGIEDSI